MEFLALDALLANLSEQPQTLHDVDEVEAKPVAALIAPVLVQLVVDIEGDGEADRAESIEDGTNQVEPTLERFESLEKL